MSSLKKIIPTIVLIILVYVWFFFIHAPQHPSKVNVLGAATNVTLFVQPDAGHDPIINAINSAQKEILVEVYLLSDKQVITALEGADSRGVDVRVMMEQHPFGGSGLNPQTKSDLESHGVETSWSNPAFALTHEKAIIIDASTLFVLSQNLTTSAFTRNREYDVLDTDAADVAEARTIFIDDWERKSFTPPEGTNLIESPNNSRGAFITLIQNSSKSIEIEAEDIDDNEIVNLLSQKAKQESVRIITPTIKQLAANSSALEKLTAAGVEVKTISSPYMHAKLILADDTRAYIGSVNFSTQSMDENRELGIILTETGAVATINSTFESDWNRATAFSN